MGLSLGRRHLIAAYRRGGLLFVFTVLFAFVALGGSDGPISLGILAIVPPLDGAVLLVRYRLRELRKRD